MFALIATSICVKGGEKAEAASTIPAFLYSGVYGSGGTGSKSGWGTSSNVPAPFSSSHGSLYGLAVKSGSTYRLGYCMGYGLSLHSSDSIAQKGTVYTSNNHGQTWSALSDWKKQYVNLAITYGLNDAKASHTAKGIQSLIKSNCSLYGATQVMVWSIVHAKSKERFASSKYRNPIRNRYLKSGDRDKYDELYDAMKNAYDGTVPDMTKSTEANAKADALLMKGNNAEKDCTVTVKDSTGLLKHGKGNKYSYSEITKVKALSSVSASKLKATVDRSSGSLKCTLPKGSIPSTKSDAAFLLTVKTYYGKYDDIKKYSTGTDTPKVVSYQKSGKGQALAVHSAKMKIKTSYVMVYAKKSNQYTAALTIKKTSSDGKVNGFRFYIRKNITDTNNYTNDDASMYAKEINTNSAGYAKIKDISPGVYDVWEVGYGYGKFTMGDFERPESEFAQQYSNQYQSAVLSLYDKTATTTKAFNDDTGATTAVTNKNINITKAETANGGDSGIFEKYNQGHIKVVVSKDSDTLLTIHNERKTNTVNINKVYDKDKEDIHGYGSQAVNEGDIFELKAEVESSSLWKSLPAALRTEFGLNSYYDKTALSTMVIDSNKKGIGQEFNVLPDINSGGAAYTTNDGADKPKKSATGKVTETYCSQGSKKFSISNNGVVDMRTLNTITLTAVNKPDSDYLFIQKIDAKTNKPVKRAGFVFEIIDANTGKRLTNSAGETRFITDAEGKAWFGDYNLDSNGYPVNVKKLKVPYGTYIVKEVEAPSPYILSEKTFYFTINPNGTELYSDAKPSDKLDEGLIEAAPEESGEVLSDLNEDKAIGGAEDAEDTSGTGGEESVNDAEEGIGTDNTLNDTNEDYKEEYDSSLEDEDGSYGGLSAAEKVLVKVQKYINDCESVKVSLSKDVYGVSFGFVNVEQLGKLKIYKTGKTVTHSAENVKKRLTKYGENYDFKETSLPLDGIEFTIKADGEIYAGTGELLYKDGEVVTTISTKDGTAEAEGLHIGNYTIQETKTLPGYVIDKKIKRFSIDHEGQDVIREYSFTNERQKAEIKVYKKIEAYTTYTDAYKSIIFGLYAKEDIKDDTGKVIVPKNSLVDTTGVLPEKDYFVGTFPEKVPYGNYYVKELKTDTRYLLDTDTYPVTFKFTDYETKTVPIRVNMEKGGFIVNHLAPVGTIIPKYKEDVPKESSRTKPADHSTLRTETTPETGDHTPILPVVFLLVLSALSLLQIILYDIKHKKQKGVSVRRKKKVFSFLWIMFFSLSGAGLLSTAYTIQAKDAGITRTAVYTTEEKEYEKSLPEGAFKESISENGKTYLLDAAGITYRVDHAKPKYKRATITHTRIQDGLKRKSYQPPKLLEIKDKDGNPVTVKLQEISYTEQAGTKSQPVTAQTSYGYLTKAPKPAGTKAVTVWNKDLGKNEKVHCRLSSVSKSKTVWKKDRTAPITVMGYGSKTYTIGKTTLTAKDVESLKNNGDVILDYLGLPLESHKITAVKWKGAAYDKKINGQTVHCRNAVATVSRKCQKYTANYQGILTVPVKTYTARALYRGKNQVQTGMKYSVTATALYREAEPEPTTAPSQSKPVKEKSNIPLIVGITVGIVLVCIGVVILIYLLSKKKKKKEGNQI